MQRDRTTGTLIAPRSARLGAAVAALTGLLALSACTSGGAGGGSSSSVGTSTAPGSSHADESSSPAAEAAVISTNVAAGDAPVSPAKPISVSIANGKLTSVKMVNQAGKSVRGALAGDGTSWRTTEVLGYSKTYRITATGANTAGAAVTKQAKVTTITPDNMTMPYIQTIAGGTVANGGKYGVGMVVKVHFDEAVDRAKAERTLKVTTTPRVEGGWYWDNSKDAYWRPKAYYAPGTKVSVSAKVYGVDVGSGLYGQDDQSVSFSIGPKHYAVANAKTHHVKVYFSDKLVRDMPTSMGQGGTTQGKFGPIYLWTMPGVYTVIGHENPATMSSDSYGLPKNSPLGYAPEKVYWSTKISTDGIYLHQLNATVWAQGHQNLSHGCLNLNLSNSRWFYKNTVLGDVVDVVHSGGPAIQFFQGGQWSVPWSKWVAGSALH